MTDSQARLQEALQQAGHGDLRPQFNPRALLSWQELPTDLKALQAILIERFFQLARPIADASMSAAGDLRLQDAGCFFYLVETLQRLRFARLEETLLIILDQFLQMEQSSYDELYLWSIVQLSRMDFKHMEAFWPRAIDLDMRFRSASWKRPPGSLLVEQPYQLTELLCYYFVLYTLPIVTTRRHPTLGACLLRIEAKLTFAEKQLVCDTLNHLVGEQGRIAFSDALGLLKHRT